MGATFIYTIILIVDEPYTTYKGGYLMVCGAGINRLKVFVVLIIVIVVVMVSFVVVLRFGIPRPSEKKDDVKEVSGTPELPPLPSKAPVGVLTRGGLGWSEDIELTDSSDVYKSRDPVVSVSGNTVHVAFETWWGSVPILYDHIQYCRSEDGGKTWTTPINISYREEPESGLPDIASYNEHVYVVWRDTRNNAPETWINISHDGGRTWIGEFNLSKIDGCYSSWPHIAVDGSTVVVVWGDDRDHPALGSNSVYLRVSLDNGTTWGPEIRVTNITDVDDRYDDIPTWVLVNGSNIYLLFDRGFPDTGYYETMFTKSSDLGQTWTTPVLLSYHDEHDSIDGSMAIYDNWIFVVWENRTPEDEIYLRRSPDLGDTWFPEQRLTWDNCTSGTPRICVDSLGVIHLMFGTNKTSPPSTCYMYSEDFGENWSAPVPVAYVPNSSYGYDFTVSKDDKMHLVWDDGRTGKSEVYYKRSPPFPPPGSIPLTNGYNYLALPSYLGDIRVGDLAAMIERDTGGTVPEIVWYRSNHWEQWVKAIGGTNNVSVDYSLGYLVHLKNVSGIVYWTPNGINYTAPLSLSLCVGWNLVSIPYSNNTLYASDIMAQNSHILAVADWDEENQVYRIYNGSDNSDDFAIQENTLGMVFPMTWNANALFILCDTYTTWTPI